MTRTLKILAAICFVVFAWYLLADRATPFTSNARVKSVVTPIVPEVSGSIVELSAQNGEIVEAGAILAVIDPRPYKIAEAQARAQLEQAAQAAGASGAEVERSQAQLVRAQTDLNNTRLQTARIFELERKGLVPIARADEARADLSDAQAGVESAEAALEAAKSRLGGEGRDNAGVQVALANLAAAELDLTRTKLQAPAYGGISNLNLSTGAYAHAGQPLMSFIDAENIWIEAYFTENNMGRMAVGTPVEIVLDMHPGRVLSGHIESFSAAVTLGQSDAPNSLASPPTVKGWMREAQRFPVRIILPDYQRGSSEDDVMFMLNGQADIVVYNGENWILNTLAAAYIRVVSVLSYAY